MHPRILTLGRICGTHVGQASCAPTSPVGSWASAEGISTPCLAAAILEGDHECLTLLLDNIALDILRTHGSQPPISPCGLAWLAGTVSRKGPFMITETCQRYALTNFRDLDGPTGLPPMMIRGGAAGRPVVRSGRGHRGAH